MEGKKAFAIQSLLVTLLLNTLLLAGVYVASDGALSGRAVTVFGLGFLFSMLLWFALQQVAGRVFLPAAPSAPERPKPEKSSPTSALQLLSLLQRKGRLIDFLQEDLNAYDDAQIGAAVRSIHEGCRQALAAHVELAPIYEAPEGSLITVPPGFDAHAVRLTGNIVGDPPFKGALRHRGWRVVRVDLPERLQSDETALILAAAEVEVNG